MPEKLKSNIKFPFVKRCKCMKKKIIGIIVDILLITMVFSVTDTVLRKVFHSESLWLELGIYLVLYAIVFGCKRGIVILWNRWASQKKENR